MSSIMRWRNGLMGLSVMAIAPVSHEVSEPHDLETGRAILLIPTSNPPRARSRWGVYRESGLVHRSTAAGRDQCKILTHSASHALAILERALSFNILSIAIWTSDRAAAKGFSPRR